MKMLLANICLYVWKWENTKVHLNKGFDWVVSNVLGITFNFYGRGKGSSECKLCHEILPKYLIDIKDAKK